MNFNALEKLAIEVALVTPTQQSKDAIAAVVPYHIVNEIRAELDRLGIDWRGAKAKLEKMSP